MTKEEKIKEAYGDTYEDYNPNEDGWIRYGSRQISYWHKNQCEEKQWLGYYFYRPKSLQGIEENNGWIKIESESDLPKENIACYFIHDDNIINGRFYEKRFECNFGVFGSKTISHYQPIEKPQPPIY